MFPFVVVGLGIIGFVFIAFVGFISELMAGPLRFEISSHPFVAGSSYQFVVDQTGMFQVRNLELKLKCREEATYSAGTSRRTETREVFQQTVAESELGEDRGLRGTLTVPSDAMHSFDSGSNKITWKLHISGRLAGILPYTNVFPVIVHPAGDTSA
jgi:hypothetical protein